MFVSGLQNSENTEPGFMSGKGQLPNSILNESYLDALTNVAFQNMELNIHNCIKNKSLIDCHNGHSRKSLTWGNTYVLEFKNDMTLAIALALRGESPRYVYRIDALHPVKSEKGESCVEEEWNQLEINEDTQLCVSSELAEILRGESVLGKHTLHIEIANTLQPRHSVKKSRTENDGLTLV